MNLKPLILRNGFEQDHLYKVKEHTACGQQYADDVGQLQLVLPLPDPVSTWFVSEV
jgi:hypothetical protein